MYSFWLFSFERSHGILGEYGTNQRTVEIQLMRKFLSSQFMKDLRLPVEFQDIFKPLLNRLYSKQSGSLQEQCLPEKDQVSGKIIQAYPNLCPLVMCELVKNLRAVSICTHAVGHTQETLQLNLDYPDSSGPR